MARLAAALRALGLDGGLSPSGRWVTLDGERCRVHVVEAPRGGGYYSWCEDPAERAVEHFTDPAAAIRSGLRRAARGPEDARKEG